MTNKEAIEILTAKAECIRRDVSGTDFACNLRNCDECDLCYAQGTTGEQREAIEMAISALETQPEYEPVRAEDFARTMSKNTIYGFIAWHGEALALMKEQGFVICKKTM